MTRHRLVKAASEAVLHAGQYAYEGRRLRKRQLRRLWITRLNIALRAMGLKYSTFIADLEKSHVAINRKILADLAVRNPKALAQIAGEVKTSGKDVIPGQTA